MTSNNGTSLRDNQTRLYLPYTRVGRPVRYSRADIAAIQQLGRSTVRETPTVVPVALTPLPKVPRPRTV